MSISQKAHKALWGRAANRCAFPGCQIELVMDAGQTEDESVIGEECHIIAREAGGPRGKSSLSSQERDKYDNLILLCPSHHTLIDKQPNIYTVDMLRAFKVAHEQWVKETLNAPKGNISSASESKKNEEEIAARTLQLRQELSSAGFAILQHFSEEFNHKRWASGANRIIMQVLPLTSEHEIFPFGKNLPGSGSIRERIVTVTRQALWTSQNEDMVRKSTGLGMLVHLANRVENDTPIIVVYFDRTGGIYTNLATRSLQAVSKHS